MTEEIPRNPDERQRRTLWIVLLLNAAIALGFFATGALGDSSALIANGLDNTSDSLVYMISLFAMSRSGRWKRAAANISGGLLLIFAVGILIDAVRRYYAGSAPLGPLMIIMALVAAIVNGICIWLLARIENPDLNVRAANTFSFNDFVSNGGILVAGGLVWWLGSNWPDLVVGAAVAVIAAWGGIGILRDAHLEHHKAVHQGNNQR
ncbi:cation transporter [Cereibacter changlensis]|jgi:cation diffusion facilitator family transporter|uniref:Cation transporter n=1 Tax=Cereibacter changlensis TaxID=402884 RepID=A0A4U0YUC0_9RHOB|nr:cation transporter [Cereibacter changlensis]TKA95315.1 cation transporter [Cereibacter changlensis]